ncbi:hypothetical protein HW555_013446, partial [Spodoptera exigua]
MFMDEEEEIVEEGCVNITLEWPPQPPRPSDLEPTPALPPPASPSRASSMSDSKITMEPSDKFKFEWRAFSMPEIEPHLRREPFSQNIGPTVSFTNPYEAFTAIWDREIIELIVRETNIYAQQLTTTMLEDGAMCPNSRITRWQDTNVIEVYTYLAIVLAMGVVVKSRLEEYWNTSKDIFSTSGFSTEMTFDRFQLLSKCLHFNNNNDCDTASLTRSQAKLFKVQPILDHLNVNFSQLYNLSQNVALDESLTMWKGWLDINQFIRNKAATVGIKTYEVCESQTGYLWRFEVHAGHDTSAVQEVHDPVSGIVPALVLRLLNGLEHKGHTIWMDNFYNSPALARELKVRGFDCVGTLRTNRQFVPSELGSITKKDMTVGQMFGCTSGDNACTQCTHPSISIHSPAQYDLIKPGKPDRLKRQCAVCKKRTVTYCKACNVAMCVFTCYEPYHTILSRLLTRVEELTKQVADLSAAAGHRDCGGKRLLNKKTGLSSSAKAVAQDSQFSVRLINNKSILAEYPDLIRPPGMHRDVLWDKTLEIYKDKNLRTAGWREICIILNEDFEEMEEKNRQDYAKSIVKKWTNIRDSWMRSINEKKKSKKSGSSATCPRAYVYHRQMLFLKKIVSPADTHDSATIATPNPADDSTAATVTSDVTHDSAMAQDNLFGEDVANNQDATDESQQESNNENLVENILQTQISEQQESKEDEPEENLDVENDAEPSHDEALHALETALKWFEKQTESDTNKKITHSIIASFLEDDLSAFECSDESVSEEPLLGDCVLDYNDEVSRGLSRIFGNDSELEMRGLAHFQDPPGARVSVEYLESVEPVTEESVKEGSTRNEDDRDIFFDAPGPNPATSQHDESASVNVVSRPIRSPLVSLEYPESAELGDEETSKPNTTQPNLAQPDESTSADIVSMRIRVTQNWSDKVPKYTIPKFDKRLTVNVRFTHKTPPIEFFDNYFPHDLVELLVEQTNIYAAQRKTLHWSPTFVAEMRAYLGVLILMGLHPLPDVNLYWSTDTFYRNPDIAQTFTQKRFKKLTENIHLNDNTKKPARDTPAHDKLYKIRPMITRLNEVFQTWVFSIKYSIGGRMYGKIQGEIKYGLDVMLRPGTSFGNFFTGIPLMNDLLIKKGIYAVGTVRLNRKGLPEKLLPKSKSKKEKLEKHEFMYKSKAPISAIQWMDTQLVNILTTANNPKSVSIVKRTQKDGSKKDITIPRAIAEYTVNMGGVDHFDHFRASYPIGRKSRRNWLRLFYFMFDAAIINSYISYIQIHKQTVHTHRDYRLRLARSLIDRFTGKKGPLILFSETSKVEILEYPQRSDVLLYHTTQYAKESLLDADFAARKMLKNVLGSFA